MWEILNSNFTILVIGFILTTIAGGLITSWIQNSSWKRETRVELYNKRFEEGIQFLDEISKLIGTRFFLMQRYLWGIEELSEEKIKEIEQEYYKVVVEWNSTYWRNRNKIRLLIGQEQAQHFLDYNDDSRPSNPRSLHYIFVKAHSSVTLARKSPDQCVIAQQEVNILNVSCSAFLELITSDFLRKATSLQLLDVPETATEKENKSRSFTKT